MPTITLNMSQAIEAVAVNLYMQLNVPGTLPVILIGKPGEGKTAIAEAATKAIGPNAKMLFASDAKDIPLHAPTREPIDLPGLPTIKDGRTTWAQSDFIPTDEDGEGVVVIDELKQCPPNNMAGFSQLIWSRGVNKHKLGSRWAMVITSNGDADKCATHKIPMHIRSRMTHIYVESCVNTTVAYANENKWHPKVIAFLRFRPELVNNFDPKLNADTYCIPRTLEALSGLMYTVDTYETNGNPMNAIVRDALIHGTIGEGAAVEFIGFLKLVDTLPDPNKVYSQPDTLPVPDDPAVCYALSATLAHKATDNTLAAILTYLDRVGIEYATKAVVDIGKRSPDLADNEAYASWCVRNNHMLS